MQTSPTGQQSEIFALSWLSNCNYGLNDTVANLQANATTKISACLQDPIITKSIGTYSLVWGPVAYSNQNLGRISVTDNLLFMAKKESDQGHITYVIATAGTNAASNYGWFKEDFVVDSQTQWSNVSGAMVANGAMNGLGILNNLKDSNQQMVVDALKNDLATLSDQTSIEVEVAVAGHSLGGTLAPLLALSLKEGQANWQPNNSKLNITVSAYPTAGPTPGNEAFSNYMRKTLDSYWSAANANDIVPHTWQNSSLNQLCDLYAGLNIVTSTNGQSGGVPGGILIQGVINWVKSLPPSSDAYYEQGFDFPFTDPGQDFTPKQINEVTALVTGVMSATPNTPVFGPIQTALKSIVAACGSSGQALQSSDVTNLFNYLTVGGSMHTTPYLANILTTPYGGDFVTQLLTYVEMGNPNYLILSLELNNLVTLFKTIGSYYVGKNGLNCGCSS